MNLSTLNYTFVEVYVQSLPKRFMYFVHHAAVHVKELIVIAFRAFDPRVTHVSETTLVTRKVPPPPTPPPPAPPPV